MMNNKRIASELSRVAKGLVAAKTWMGGNKCDLCHKPISGYLYDSVTSDGRWGTLCKRCWQYEGGNIGEGRGQEFVETEPGKFEMNRGGIGMGRKNNHLKPYRSGRIAKGLVAVNSMEDLSPGDFSFGKKMMEKGYKYMAQITTIDGDYGEPLCFKGANEVGPFLRSFPDYMKARAAWIIKLED